MFVTSPEASTLDTCATVPVSKLALSSWTACPSHAAAVAALIRVWSRFPFILRRKSAGPIARYCNPIAVCCSQPGGKVEIQPYWLLAAARINGSNAYVFSCADGAATPLDQDESR